MSSADIQPSPLFPAHSPLVIQKDLLHNSDPATLPFLLPTAATLTFQLLLERSGHSLGLCTGVNSAWHRFLVATRLVPSPHSGLCRKPRARKSISSWLPHHSLTLYLALSFFITIITTWEYIIYLFVCKSCQLKCKLQACRNLMFHHYIHSSD